MGWVVAKCQQGRSEGQVVDGVGQVGSLGEQEGRSKQQGGDEGVVGAGVEEESSAGRQLGELEAVELKAGQREELELEERAILDLPLFE